MMNWELEIDGNEYQVCSNDGRTYTVYRTTQAIRTKLGGFTTESEDPDRIRDETELVIEENL